MKYEYGVEYETYNKNGYSRPNGLGNDVLVECYFFLSPVGWRKDKVQDVQWCNVAIFKVVDERYKPKSGPLTDKGAKWHERGELPPVGEVVKYRYMRSKTTCTGTCEILGYNGDYVWFKPTCAKHVTMKVCGVHLNPIPTERDKLVESAEHAVESVTMEPVNSIHLGALIDAGWRPIKQQSESEFVDYAIGCWEGMLPTHQWREMYRAGCRFIEQGE